MASRKKEKEIDPDILMKNKFRAKCRFRALVRLAVANAYWLLDYSGSYKGDDVKMRIEQAVRGKKGLQLLSVDDKALLNKPAVDRTDVEKKYIYRKIGGLKCFKRFPNNVKRKLAAVTYFKYFGPNRDIIREQQEAQAMYFMVTGKVNISRKVYDGLLEQWVSVVIGTRQAGDMFGDVSLLHNIPRSATVTTTEHCELLVLGKDDFKTVLQVSVQKQWDEVREAMNMFTYFEGLDDVAKREACIVAKMKKYNPDEIILGDGHGVANHVYFIINGRCQMIELIKCFVTKQGGNTFYTLFDPFEPEEETEEDLEKKYSHFGTSGVSFNVPEKPKRKSVQCKRRTSSTIPLTITDLNLNEDVSETENLKRDDDIPSPTLMPRSMTKSRINIDRSDTDFIKAKKHVNTKNDDGIDSPTLLPRSMTKSRIHIEHSDSSFQKLRFRLKSIAEDDDLQKQHSNILSRIATKSRIDIFKSDSRLKKVNGHKITSRDKSHGSLHKLKVTPEPSLMDQGSKRLLVEGDAETGPNAETFFMQVLQYYQGSSFGFGENMRDRRIVALTPMLCLLLPKVWLLQHNTANIWTRIEHFLSRKIPNKRQLFKQLVNQRNWEDYRQMIVTDVVSNSKAINYTSVHDVPYSIRLEELHNT